MSVPKDRIEGEFIELIGGLAAQSGTLAILEAIVRDAWSSRQSEQQKRNRWLNHEVDQLLGKRKILKDPCRPLASHTVKASPTASRRLW